MKKYFTGLKNFLTGRRPEEDVQEDSSRRRGEATENVPIQLRRAIARMSIRDELQRNPLVLVRQDLRRYQKRDLADLDLDLDIIRSKLLLEYQAHRKVPVFSEHHASYLLWEKSLPELPKKLAGLNMESLHMADIFIEYWYWALVAEGRATMDPQVRCQVTIPLPEDDSTKLIRPSWAMPLRLIAEEVRFFLPLIDRFKLAEAHYCLFYQAEGEGKCMMQHNRHYFEMLEKSFPGHYQFVVINYQVFDSVVPSRVVELCFDVLMQKMDFSHERRDNGTLKEVDAAANERRFEMMVQYFLKIPIHVSGKNNERFVVSKTRGIPSGSCFTHLIRTMSNFVITWMTCNMVWQRIPRAYRFHGKKCVVAFDSKVKLDLEAFSKCARTNFGVIVDPHRTCITANIEDFHTLRYCCNTDNEDD